MVSNIFEGSARGLISSVTGTSLYIYESGLSSDFASLSASCETVLECSMATSSSMPGVSTFELLLILEWEDNVEFLLIFADPGFASTGFATLEATVVGAIPLDVFE